MRSLLLLYSLFAGFFISVQGQSTDQIKRVIEYAIKDLENFRPKEVNDEIVDGSRFLPPDGNIDPGILEPAFRDPESRIKASLSLSGTVIEGEEIWLQTIELKAAYWDLPGWKSTGLYIDVGSVIDSLGNDLLVSEDRMMEYMDRGVIDPPQSFPGYPETEKLLVLEREVEYGEKVNVKGTLYWNYPSRFETVIFSKEDIGKQKVIGKYTVKLRDIDRDMAVIEVEGGRGFDTINKLFVDAQDNAFQSNTSVGIFSEVYDAAIKYNYELTEEQINALVEDYEPYSQKPKVYVYNVSGTIVKIALYKVLDQSEKEVPFDKQIEYQY